MSITAAEFKKKWSRYQGKESAAYQEHFIDLCRLLGQPTPVEADPSGNDFFCFQKRVVKGAEFLNLGKRVKLEIGTGAVRVVGSSLPATERLAWLTAFRVLLGRSVLYREKLKR